MKLQKLAAAILVLLGAGHLVIVLIMEGTRMLDWIAGGLWAAVPLRSQATVEALQNALTFWGGIGSFAIPSILLGGSLWASARTGVPVPAWIAWGG